MLGVQHGIQEGELILAFRSECLVEDEAQRIRVSAFSDCDEKVKARFGGDAWLLQ